MSNNFLSLPRELRDCVYHELWEFTPYIHITPCQKVVSNRGMTRVRAWYRRADNCSTPQGLPSWLRTSKQILAEATEEFELKGIWIFGIGARYDPALVPPILSALQARHVALDLQRSFYLSPEDELFYTPGSCLKLNERAVEWVNKIVKYLKPARSVTELTVHLRLNHMQQLTKYIDFQGLGTTLAALQPWKFNVKVRYCCSAKLTVGVEESIAQAISNMGAEVLKATVASNVSNVREYSKEISHTLNFPTAQT